MCVCMCVCLYVCVCMCACVSTDRCEMFAHLAEVGINRVAVSKGNLAVREHLSVVANRSLGIQL